MMVDALPVVPEGRAKRPAAQAGVAAATAAAAASKRKVDVSGRRTARPAAAAAVAAATALARKKRMPKPAGDLSAKGGGITKGARTVHAEGHYPCRVCGKICSSAQQLGGHQNSHRIDMSEGNKDGGRSGSVSIYEPDVGEEEGGGLERISVPLPEVEKGSAKLVKTPSVTAAAAGRSRPTNNQLLYMAHFRWSHYQHKHIPGQWDRGLPAETEACASVTSAFLQVLAALHGAETQREVGARNVLKILSANTRRTKVVELASGSHRVPDELKKHCLGDKDGKEYSTNLDRNRYGTDDQYLNTVIQYDLEYLGLCPCLVDVEIIDAKSRTKGLLIQARPEQCICNGRRTFPQVGAIARWGAAGKPEPIKRETNASTPLDLYNRVPVGTTPALVPAPNALDMLLMAATTAGKPEDEEGDEAVRARATAARRGGQAGSSQCEGTHVGGEGGDEVSGAVGEDSGGVARARLDSSAGTDEVAGLRGDDASEHQSGWGTANGGPAAPVSADAVVVMQLKEERAALKRRESELETEVTAREKTILEMQSRLAEADGRARAAEAALAGATPRVSALQGTVLHKANHTPLLEASMLAESFPPPTETERLLSRVAELEAEVAHLRDDAERPPSGAVAGSVEEERDALAEEVKGLRLALRKSEAKKDQEVATMAARAADAERRRIDDRREMEAEARNAAARAQHLLVAAEKSKRQAVAEAVAQGGGELGQREADVGTPPPPLAGTSSPLAATTPRHPGAAAPHAPPPAPVAVGEKRTLEASISSAAAPGPGPGKRRCPNCLGAVYAAASECTACAHVFRPGSAARKKLRPDSPVDGTGVRVGRGRKKCGACSAINGAAKVLCSECGHAFGASPIVGAVAALGASHLAAAASAPAPPLPPPPRPAAAALLAGPSAPVPAQDEGGVSTPSPSLPGRDAALAATPLPPLVPDGSKGPAAPHEQPPVPPAVAC